MSLEQLQKEFIEFLYTAKPGEEQKNHIRSYFLDPQHSDPHNGLKIYRGNLVFGLIGAMKKPMFSPGCCWVRIISTFSAGIFCIKILPVIRT